MAKNHRSLKGCDFPPRIWIHAEAIGTNPSRWTKEIWRQLAINLADKLPVGIIQGAQGAAARESFAPKKRGRKEKFSAAEAVELLRGADSERRKMAAELGRPVTWVEMFEQNQRRSNKENRVTRSQTWLREVAVKEANWLRNLRRRTKG